MSEHLIFGAASTPEKIGGKGGRKDEEEEEVACYYCLMHVQHAMRLLSLSSFPCLLLLVRLSVNLTQLCFLRSTNGLLCYAFGGDGKGEGISEQDC